MRAGIIIANIVGWPVIQIAIAKAMLRVPAELFDHDSFFFVPREWEQDGALYRRYFAIRKWKSLLPDGAAWLGGLSKKRLPGRDSHSLRVFLVETRRAELAHWCMLFCAPVFFLWNPPWACAVMALYAVVANLPCILAQRYNRLVLIRLLRRPVPSVALPGD